MDIRTELKIVYETLDSFVEADTIGDKSKYVYRNNLQHLKKFNGSLDDTTELTELLDTLTHNIRHGILNVIIKFLKQSGNDELYDYYYQLRHQGIQKDNETDKLTELGDLSIQQLLQKLKSVPNNPYKLICY